MAVAEKVLTKRKELHIYPVPASGLVRISWKDGGPPPIVLSGHYTSNSKALEAINNWLVANNDPRDDIPPAIVVTNTPVDTSSELPLNFSSKGVKRGSGNS